MNKAGRLFVSDRLKACMVPIITGLILITSQVWATPSNPSEEVKAARRYLTKLSRGNLDLAQDTAISAHCSPQRRKQIGEQLKFFSQTHLDGNDTFIFEVTKNEGNFAAVLLRSKNPSMPLEPRVHAVALLHRQHQWIAAPLPGNFANTGYGYDAEVEKSVLTLERWMTKEKIILQSKARQSAQDNFLKSISEEEKKAALDTLSPQQATLNFIQLCRNTKLFGVLATLGAASDELEDSLKKTLSIVSNGLNNKNPLNKWSLVTHPSVIIVPVHLDPIKKDFAVGFWHPLVSPPEEILYFQTHKAKDKTFIRLPHDLIMAAMPENNRWRQQKHPDYDAFKKKLAAEIYKNHPPHKAPDNTQELLDHFTQSLSSQDFLDCFKLLPRYGGFFSAPKNQHKILNQLSDLWKNINHSKSNTQINPELLVDEKLALLPLIYPKKNHPSEVETIRVWFIQENNGWHLVPETTLNNYAALPLRTNIQRLKTRLQSVTKQRQEQLSRSQLSQVVTLTPPLTLQPVDDKAAEKTLSKFRTLLRANNPQSALEECAVLKGSSSIETLKTFNYALRGASDHRKDDHILGIHRAGKWLGISLRTESKTTGDYHYPLYIIINTEKGPRILLDIDLRHATNKGRKLINRRNLNKLEKVLPKNDQTDILSIFTEHDKVALEDIKSSVPLKH